MYDRRVEIRVRKSAAQAMRDKQYQEVPDKAPPSRDEIICKHCGFKARYQFVRCPECNEVQK